MLIKHLLSKCPALLSGQGKNSALLWHYTVRRYGKTNSAGSDDSEEKWHSERCTCRLSDTPHSPIDINSKTAVCREYMPITLAGYDKPGINMVISNNGYLVKIDFPSGELRYTGGGVYEKYKTDHLHFHWGNTSAYGSEHYLDGQSFPMEMHIVNHNLQYKTLVEAEGKGTGLAVLAFFFERSSSNNPALNPITDMLKEIKTPYTSVPLQMPSLMSILPGDLEEYFQYSDVNISGFPTITWTVFKEPIKISETQLAEFRKLKSSEIEPGTKKPLPLGDNNRAPEDIPKLAVFTNEFDQSESPKKKKKSLGKSILGAVFGKKKKKCRLCNRKRVEPRACVAEWYNKMVDKMVNFATGPHFLTVHFIDTEERNGNWHHVIRERKNFERRILELEPILTPVLGTSHRAKVLEHRNKSKTTVKDPKMT